MLELPVLERLDLAAGVTDEVVMVAAGMNRLVARDAGPEVDPLNETLGRQQVEHPVDARDPDTAPVCAKPVENLLRREAAVLGGKQVDDRPTGSAVPQSLAVERLERRPRPFTLGRRCHSSMVAVLMYAT